MHIPELPSVPDQTDNNRNFSFDWLNIEDPVTRGKIIENIRNVTSYYEVLSARNFLFVDEPVFQSFFEELGRGINHVKPDNEDESIVPYIVHREEIKAGGGPLTEKKKAEILIKYSSIVTDFFKGNTTFSQRKIIVANLTYVLQAYARSKGQKFMDVFRETRIQGMDLWVTVNNLYKAIHKESIGAIPEEKKQKLFAMMGSENLSLTSDLTIELSEEFDDGTIVQGVDSYNPTPVPVDSEGYLVIPFSSSTTLPEWQSRLFVGERSVGYLNTNVDVEELKQLFRSVSPDPLVWANILRLFEIHAKKTSFSNELLNEVFKQHELIAENFIKIFHIMTSASNNRKRLPEGILQAITDIQRKAQYQVGFNRLLILEGRLRQMLPEMTVNDRLKFTYELITSLGFRINDQTY